MHKITSSSFACLILVVLFYLHGNAQSFSDVVEVLKDDILANAEWAMTQKPVTVTASVCDRSAGGKHDFYSEGDYWWPDPDHPGGPYIQRDGMTNPENFVDHRKAMIRFSRIIGSLASAYRITRDEKCVKQSISHLQAWFVDTTTMMNPNLLYAQAISGRVTGRGIGIIDTIHLMEVAQGVNVMQDSPLFSESLLNSIKAWFEKYLQWLTTHPYGLAEMNAENNHGTCWVMQVASFASLTENETIVQMCRKRYKDVILPNQMAIDGSFPRELRRTKPYGYSLFNLDAMTMVCQILSDDQHDLWQYRTADGKNIRTAIEFLFPFVKNKTNWPFAEDVMYWDEWPVAHPFILFGAREFNVMDWFDAWNELEHNPTVDEVLRNLPIRNPVIWIK